MTSLRRSSRLASYDSNGRDYLANQLGWDREKLQVWLGSADVAFFLGAWLEASVLDRRRMNEAIDWINEGPAGYFYEMSGLQKVVLCMCRQADQVDKYVASKATFDIKRLDTPKDKWPTEAIWASTAWNVVRANSSPEQAFGSMTPTRSYGFMIDLLSIGFHSIAFRESHSVWTSLINHGSQQPCAAVTRVTRSTRIQRRQTHVPLRQLEPLDEICLMGSSSDRDSSVWSDLSSLTESSFEDNVVVADKPRIQQTEHNTSHYRRYTTSKGLPADGSNALPKSQALTLVIDESEAESYGMGVMRLFDEKGKLIDRHVTRAKARSALR